MQEQELRDLVSNIKKIKSESNNLELKAASKGCPERLYDTLSSFSNQDSGGTIVFGINEKNNYSVSGVYDANDLIKKVTEQCNQMEPSIRPFFTTAVIDDKKVVSLEVTGIDYMQRPCFYKGAGKYNGSFIRVGDSDEKMSEYEIYSYEAYKNRTKDDLRTIDDTSIALFDKDKFALYLKAVKDERTNLSNNVSTKEIEQLMGLVKNGKPTLASVMVFSKYPQAYFPQYSVLALSIPGTEKGDTSDDNERFIDNKRITGPIDQMVDDCMQFVRKNIKYKTIIDEYGHREDRYEYPLKAIREAILNALIHRDYSRYSEGIPVCLDIYTDRIEITNPGNVYGGVPINELGVIRPETRNMILANILELLHVTENRYSGIPTIKKELANCNMPNPIFISNQGQFKIIIRKAIDDEKDSLEEKVLTYCITPRTREEICSYLKLSRNHVMSKIIPPLVDRKKLLLTIPDKPKSSLQKYYTNSK